MTLPRDSHVCFVCPYIGAYLEPGSRTHVGGAERQQHLLATRLREDGHAVSFITFEAGGDAYRRVDGFDVWRTLPRTSEPIRAPQTFVRLLTSIRRVDADVFYVRGNPPLCILASYCCSLLDESLVYVVANDSNVELDRLSSHHGLFRYTLARLTYLDAIRRAGRVVAQTDHQRRILGDVFGIRSTVVPNGYTVPPEEEVLPPSDRTHVLWVGSLDPEQKRPERFLRLAERLPDVDFRMVGSAHDDGYRETIATRASAIPNLTFEGFVPPDQIDEHYRTALALVNTSEYEGFPNTFLEAWRFCVPVVSLHHTLDGVLAEQDIGHHAGTMASLETIVADLWADPDTAVDTGRNGRRYLEENFALDVVFEAYERIFADLVNDRAPGGG